MPRHTRIVTIHDAATLDLLQHLGTYLSRIPGMRGGTKLQAFQVWHWIGMPMKDLAGKECGFTAEEAAHNDGVLRALNVNLVRGIEPTQELKELLGISSDPGFDRPEWPVTWRLIALVIPKLTQEAGPMRSGKMTKEEMRTILDRLKATLHMQIDDALASLCRLVDKHPKLAERIAKRLKRRSD